MNRTVVGVCAAVILSAAIVGAQAQSSDEPSLGDVARATRAKRGQESVATVFDNEEMARHGLSHPSAEAFDCDEKCIAKARSFDYSHSLEDATGKQLEDVFAVAIADLAKGDWGRRLSEIREEVCRNPGDVNSKQRRGLEGEMFAKLRLEYNEKHIDETAAKHPNDAVGAEALRQVRIQEAKTSMLEGKVELMRSSCASAAKMPGK